ncbi:MAG TPA: aspartate/glutamate racemase family protein [Methylomirabilota bacterium]|jgi:maleate cis-trans isomerase|nr:aspartate/glutamate racemase family protein [Methylomirabilota bacterium]
MSGRIRIGVLVPPGNPTVEPELYRMAPPGVTFHFARLDPGPEPNDPGSRTGMNNRTREYLASLPVVTRALAQVRPAVVVHAHTASSYAKGFANEPAFAAELASLTGAPAVTAAGAVRAALQHLGVKRVGLGTPYEASVSEQGKAYWQAAGFEIVGYGRLGDTGSIYDETEERAYALAREADAPDADGVLLSGTGLPTIGVLERLERDLGKPVVSSVQACLWHALRVAGRRETIDGFGRLLRSKA